MAYIDELNAIWLDVKEYLCETMARRTVELWFGDFKVADYKDDVIIFSTESEFKYNKANLSSKDILKLSKLIKSQINNRDIFSINDKRNILEKSIEKFKIEEAKNKAR